MAAKKQRRTRPSRTTPQRAVGRNTKKGSRPNRRRAKAKTEEGSKTATGDRQPPRGRARRVFSGLARVGIVLGLAWAGLVGAREVYEYATTSQRFEIRSLVYEPTVHVDDDRVRELLALTPATNILSLDLPTLESRIEADAWVADAEVIRHLPDALEVRVTEHEARAVVLAGHFYLVDDTGMPFKRADEGERGELPIVTGVDRQELLEDREAARERVARALKVLDTYAEKRRPRLSEVNVDETEAITLFTAEAGTQLRLGRQEPALALERYDALRAALGERAERLAVVHLDGGQRDGERQRVAARFTEARDEADLLAEASASQKQAPSERGGAGLVEAPPPKPKKKRIPRYE